MRQKGVVMIEVKHVDKADERRDFPRGHLEVLNLSGLVFAVASFEPGWRWTESVGPIAGTELCEVHHNGYIVEGRMRLRMRDGSEAEAAPADVFVCPPAHEAGVAAAGKCWSTTSRVAW